MPTEQEWDDRKESIRQLWLVQDLPMKKLITSMKAIGFHATKRQFEYQMRDRWDWRKRPSGSWVVPQDPQGDTHPDNQDIIFGQRPITEGKISEYYPSVDTNTSIWNGSNNVQLESASALDDNDTVWGDYDTTMASSATNPSVFEMRNHLSAYEIYHHGSVFREAGESLNDIESGSMTTQDGRHLYHHQASEGHHCPRSLVQKDIDYSLEFITVNTEALNFCR